jgi:hypothetical protein
MIIEQSLMQCSLLLSLQGFLAVDVVLNLLMNIADGMVVWPNVVEKHVMEELPFMATEVILMECECNLDDCWIRFRPWQSFPI